MQTERDKPHMEHPPDARALPCFLWGAARSGTNVITRNLARSTGVACFNEDDPRAFDNFFLLDGVILDELVVNSRAKAVFFKSFNDTPRAREVMARFPTARAIYAIRAPEDTIASFASTWREDGGVLWANRLIEASLGRPGMLTRLGASDPGIARAIRDAATEAVALLRSFDRTDGNVAALYYLWQHSFFIRERLADSGRVLLVDYERLTSEPVQQMARIASWFGVESAVHSADGWHRGRGAGRARDGVAPELLARCRDLYESIARVAGDARQPLSAAR